MQQLFIWITCTGYSVDRGGNNNLEVVEDVILFLTRVSEADISWIALDKFAH